MIADLTGTLVRRLPILLTQLMAALAMLALPNLTRRDLLFGVPVTESFRLSKIGRGAIRSYRLTIIAIAVISMFGFFWIANPIFLTASVLVEMAAGSPRFVAPFKKTPDANCVGRSSTTRPSPRPCSPGC